MYLFPEASVSVTNGALNPNKNPGFSTCIFPNLAFTVS